MNRSLIHVDHKKVPNADLRDIVDDVLRSVQMESMAEAPRTDLVVLQVATGDVRRHVFPGACRHMAALKDVIIERVAGVLPLRGRSLAQALRGPSVQGTSEKRPANTGDNTYSFFAFLQLTSALYSACVSSWNGLAATSQSLEIPVDQWGIR
jgi:hypothetical protein